ncbi:MAG: zinc ribbon domain-containing protein [Ignavibacteriaceae bacterium]|nr:zinc ribbon domain-containing protein [Ignavibacteriaceae bacterium]
MPTYDYKCSNCSYTFEFFQSMTSEPLTECPKCKGTLKRIIGVGAGPLFKGSGFYQTDYKQKESKSKKSGESSSGHLSTETKKSKEDKK